MISVGKWRTSDCKVRTPTLTYRCHNCGHENIYMSHGDGICGGCDDSIPDCDELVEDIESRLYYHNYGAN